VAGWLSHEDALDFLFRGEGHLRYDRAIRREVGMLEGGAYNGVGLAALEAGIAPIEALGVPRIFEHVQRYLDPLEEALVERAFVSERSPDPARRSGILSVRAPHDIDVALLSRALLARGVVTSTPDGRLRFAPHWPNALEEVPDVVAALDDALAEVR
jgi:selenocysteine lyase/cysteine desulfurase